MRFTRSLKIGVIISMDYLIAPIIGYTESEIHQRSADRIVQGCLQNGGIYIKLGQGLAAINHILPREYIESLSILQVHFYKHKTIIIKNYKPFLYVMFIITFNIFKLTHIFFNYNSQNSIFLILNKILYNSTYP